MTPARLAARQPPRSSDCVAHFTANPPAHHAGRRQHASAFSRVLRRFSGGPMLALLALLASPALAHKSSDAYLFIDQQPAQTTLRWDIALRDLDVALALDADGNRALTWGEVRAAWPRIDPTHRGIVRHTVAGNSPTLRMLVPAPSPHRRSRPQP